MSDYPSLFDGDFQVSTEALPVTPYDGSSGWSGTETSHQRAIDADKNGGTKWRQEQTLRFIASRKERGATWREVADYLGVHHGASSGALSVLHKVEQLARLKETRSGSKVYVVPEFVDGRETEPFGRVKKTHLCSNCGAEVA